MSEELNQQQDELATLKARADLLKIQYHPSIGIEKLREKVAAAMADEPSSDPTPPVAPVADAPAAPVVETEGMRRRRKRDDAMRLVRIRLTCMNPAKADWEGEIIATGNSLVGTVKKFVPFNAEDGWHVPHILLEQLQERRCQIFVKAKSRVGADVLQGKLIKEFAIEILDPLSPEELHDLAQRQAMAKSID